VQGKEIKLLGICGSLRKESYNKHLLDLLQQHLKAEHVDLKCINLLDYELPLYNHDIASTGNIPQAVHTLRQLLDDSHGLLLVTPEYCGSVPGALKNAIDWLSIPLDREDAVYAAFKDKPWGIAIATTSKVGGLKCVEHLKGIAGSVGSVTMPRALVIHETQELTAIKLQHVSRFTQTLAKFVRRWYGE